LESLRSGWKGLGITLGKDWAGKWLNRKVEYRLHGRTPGFGLVKQCPLSCGFTQGALRQGTSGESAASEIAEIVEFRVELG
jgi:hypothetical protein